MARTFTSILPLIFMAAAAFAQASGNEQEDPLDLGILEIEQERWTYEQEITMRMIKKAYGQPRSEELEDLDIWVCWIGNSGLSKFSYLRCARNGDIMAQSPKSWFPDSPPLHEQGYGTILVSTHRVIRHEFEEDLETFRGGDTFNEEFIAKVAAGDRPPRNIPNDEEMTQYIAARTKADELGPNQSYRRSEIIKEEGLSIHRFEQIAYIIDIYESIQAQFLAAGGIEEKPTPP